MRGGPKVANMPGCMQPSIAPGWHAAVFVLGGSGVLSSLYQGKVKMTVHWLWLTPWDARVQYGAGGQPQQALGDTAYFHSSL